MKMSVVAAFVFFACLQGLAQPAAWAQAAASRGSVQKSLGFEDQTSAVLSGWWANPPGTVSADNSVAHTGKWSVRLQRDAQSQGTFSVITRMLPVDFQGGTVELRGYLRLQDATGNAGLWLREDGGGQMLSLENMDSQQVKGTRDWAQYSIKLPIDRKADQLYFGVLAGGTGTLWADDLELLVDGKPIAEAAPAEVNGGGVGDNEFDSGSKVALSGLTPVQVSNLVTLGRVWGFLKYHHPAVTGGERRWDYELFRVMPAVLAAGDRAGANEVLVAWIDKLGPVAACSACVGVPSGDIAIKPELEWIHDKAVLGGALSARLEWIYANRTGKQFYVSKPAGAGNPKFDHEASYSNVAFPDSGYQVLALFRWWNILQYWAPDRDVAGQDWAKVLAEFIPKVGLAKDKTAYTLALFELIGKANDTHANVWGAVGKRPPVGDCGLAVGLRPVGDKFVVYTAESTYGALKPGDVVEKLDGVAVDSLVGKWSVYYADSNEAARRRDLAAYMTRGECGPASVEVKRGGRSMEVAVTRTAWKPSFATHDRGGETFELLSPEVAYLKLSSIKAAELPDYFERAKNTKGLIVDIRNYPSEFMPFAMGAYFASKETPFVTFTFADLANPGAFRFGDGPKIGPGPVHYGGKVVILVDETTQSQAEYTAMALRAMGNSIVVGSTTAGADGNVSSIPLPGDLSTMISGLGVFYPDRRPTQRVGIVPDVVVKPTVEGIAAGRDEVVEAAVKVIMGAK